MINSHSFPLRAERFNKRHSYAEYVFVIWEVVSIHPRGDIIKKHFFTSEGSSTDSYRKSWNYFYWKVATTRVVEANVDINYLTDVNDWAAMFLTFYFVCGSQKSAKYWKFFSKIFFNLCCQPNPYGIWQYWFVYQSAKERGRFWKTRRPRCCITRQTLFINQKP